MTSISDRLQLRIEPDGLAAWVAVAAGPALTIDALRECLAEACVTAGIGETIVATVASALGDEAAALPELCIARGRAAVDATPDRLELREAVGPIAGVLQDDESFDYRERRLIVPVKEGDELGRIVSGSPGVPGFTVRGAELAALPAAPLEFSHGDGIALDEDGGLRAARSGARTLKKDGSLDVVALHLHPDGVDLASGNLETEGSLRIARDVAEGMSVRSGIDLEIRGTVDAARIESGGSIEIRGGVLGAGVGRVRARGDMKVGHALAAHLVAGGRLSVARSVLTSELQAREIEVRGQVLGDRLQAETRIVVRDVGSPTGSACVLRAAHPLEDFDGDRAGERAGRERARAVLTGGPERLAARKSRDTGKGRRERPTGPTAPEIESKRSFRKRERELQPEARIEIQGTAHPGCRIDFGGRPLVLEQAVRSRVYRFDCERDEIVEEGS